MEAEYRTGCVEETWAVARQFAAELEPGDIVALEGDLGAGKTTFVQGLAAALGSPCAVTSPTFCLAAEHRTDRMLLVHLDLYRLHGPDDVLDLGWEDYLARGAALCVEWPDRAGDLIPQDAWYVGLAQGDAEDARVISFRKGIPA